MGIGMVLAIPIGLAQAVGPWYLAIPARVFCTIIRGTPLLMQLWVLYYGLGSLFPSIPGLRDSFLWPILRQAWPYAVVALSLSVAGYEGEVMRGAFKSVQVRLRYSRRRAGSGAFQVSMARSPTACASSLPLAATSRQGRRRQWRFAALEKSVVSYAE